jgi:hypothetical protein
MKLIDLMELFDVAHISLHIPGGDRGEIATN